MAELTVYELAGLPSVSLTGMTKGTDYLQITSPGNLANLGISLPQ
jgi:hypothetical protein